MPRPPIEATDEQFTRQLNIRVDPEAVRNLRAIRHQTGEMYGVLIRRLLREEAERIGKGETR